MNYEISSLLLNSFPLPRIPFAVRMIAQIKTKKKNELGFAKKPKKAMVRTFSAGSSPNDFQSFSSNVV